MKNILECPLSIVIGLLMLKIAASFPTEIRPPPTKRDVISHTKTP